MTSVVSSRTPALGDLTARARIRDAALRLMAEHGVDGATIRDIAQAAGVSAGLVRHHYGSKDDLRAACDAYALDQIVQIKEQAIVDGQVADLGFMAAAHPTILLVYRYFARSMVDGSPQAAAMFEEMVDLTVTWLRSHGPVGIEDVRAHAAIVVTTELGLLAMHEPLSRALGVDTLSPEGHLRLTRAKVDFYSHPLLGPDVATGARATIDALAHRHAGTTRGDRAGPGGPGRRPPPA